MKIKTFLLNLGLGLLAGLLLFWKFFMKVNTPNQTESPITEKLEKQHKHLELEKDKTKMETVKKKILKTAKKQKEDLNEKTMSELIDIYNSKSDD